MQFAEEERQRLDTWTQYIRVEDMRSLAEEALRRVAARGPKPSNILTRNTTVADEVHAFCAILLGHPFADAEEAVLARLKQGSLIEAVYRDYLGGAAIRLGEMWEDDEISFIDVTRAVARIIVLMRNLRERIAQPRITRAAPILFATVPGETHALGVTMARDLFRDRGWDVNLLVGLTHESLIDYIAKTDARLLGLSCGGPATAGALARLILGVRLVRPMLPVVISGQVMANHPDLVEALAPDGAIDSIEAAVSEIERLTGP